MGLPPLCPCVVNHVKPLYTQWEKNPLDLIIKTNTNTLLTFNPEATPFNPEATPFNPEATPFNPEATPFDTESTPFNPEATPFNPKATQFNPEATPFNPDTTNLQFEGAVETTPPHNSTVSPLLHEDSGFLSVAEGYVSSLDDEGGAKPNKEGGAEPDEEGGADPDKEERDDPVDGEGGATCRDGGLSPQDGTCVVTRDGSVSREKYSPQQLRAIQERVKESLKRQGVYLYDPLTGAGKG